MKKLLAIISTLLILSLLTPSLSLAQESDLNNALSSGQGIKEASASLSLSATGLIPGIPAFGAINSIRRMDVVGDGVKAAIQGGRRVQAELGFPNVKAGSMGGETASKRFPDSVRNKAAEETGGACVFCGSRTSSERGPLQQNADHSIPKARGGNASLENAQNTCRTCNIEKSDATSGEFIQKIMRTIWGN
ncbi:MAG: HNH endonuclease signature motif containing protein [bacterium]|nr:HNH endonuclease signature motif containing protein [bacterium]